MKVVHFCMVFDDVPPNEVRGRYIIQMRSNNIWQ